MRKLTTEQFIAKARAKHGNTYIYSNTVYTGSENYVTIICPKHGYFKQLPGNHLKYGCAKCGLERQVALRTSNTKDFVKRAKNIHKGYYKYDCVDYKNAKTPVRIFCPQHGYFMQVPDVHLRGNGCPKCGQLRGAQKAKTTKAKTNSQRLPLEVFKHRGTRLFDGRYDYSLIKEEDWRGLKTVVPIICPVHGIYLQRASVHMSGCGCRKCYQSRGEREIVNYLKNTSVTYKTEYKINECADKLPLPFDFAIFNSDGTLRCLIEYQGRQHYKPVYFWGKTQEDVVAQQKRDEIKRKYCTEHDIVLLEVSYKQDLSEFFEEAGGLLWK